MLFKDSPDPATISQKARRSRALPFADGAAPISCLRPLFDSEIVQ